MTLPPGVTAKDFADAIAAFQGAVGKEWVFTSDEDVALYRDAYTPFWNEPEEKVASAAVAPASVEEVQAVMKAANERRIPIYPISTGRNLGYGGSAPVLSGSVVLDLKRMNRILDVDEPNASCLVEPGVSYFDLYRYIHDKGLKLWIDPPDPGWGSPIGNALDHGAGQTTLPHRDHFRSHCGMEVVLANGDVVRTGMGALPNSQTWQQFAYGFGPWVDGIFSQSNMGVVTKMGFWLMTQPDAYRGGTVLVPRHDDLIPMIDVMKKLQNIGLFTATTGLGSPLLERAGIDPKLDALMGKPGGASPAELETYAGANGLAYWSCQIRLFGPAKVVDAQWDYCKSEFAAAVPNARFDDGEMLRFPLSDAEIEKLANPVWFGIPSLRIFSLGARSPFNPNPNSGHLWFSPVIPMTGEAIIEANRVFGEAFKTWGVNPLSFPVPQSYHPRTFVMLYGFPITRDVETNRKNRETFRRMVKLAAEHGWAEYRTAPAFMDDVADTYSFNNHALRRLHETLKDALDPNGILSAGRYGIWPKHLRETRGAG
jgi:FAD/FMN-containing dehydrogenase